MDTAFLKAEEMVAAMEAKGVVEFKNDSARIALRAAVQMIIEQTPEGILTANREDRLKAIKIVLDFTMTKPVQKLEVATAENWLKEVAAADEADKADKVVVKEQVTGMTKH